MDANDRVLLNQWRLQRDEQAFLTLMRRYAGLVYGTCRRVLNDSTEAEDVTQECFEALALRTRQVGPNLGPWLHRHAIYRSLDRLRQMRRRTEREKRYSEDRPSQDGRGWDDLYMYVDDAINSLPEKLREPIVDHFLNGQTVEGIAERSSVTRQTIHNRINDGLEKIRRALAARQITVAVAVLAALMEANACEAAPAALLSRLGKLALAGPALTAATGGLLSQVTLLRGVLSVAIIAAISTAVYISMPEKKKPERPHRMLTPAAQIPVKRFSTAKEVKLTEVESPPPAPAAAPVEEKKTVDVGVVHGLVLDEGLSPVAGATLTLEDADPGNRTPDSYRAETISDAQGRFRFESVPLTTDMKAAVMLLHQGKYKVTARTADLSGGVSVAASHPLRESYVEILVSQAHTLSGTVMTESGQPLPGATLKAVVAGAVSSRFFVSAYGTTQSGPDGSFHLRDLFPMQYMLEISATGLPSVTSGPYQTGASGLVIRVPDPIFRVRGRIMDSSNGHPIAGGTVCALGKVLKYQQPVIFKTTSDEQGQFEFNELGPDTYIFYPAEGEYTLAQDPEPVLLDTPGQAVDVVVQAVKGATVGGRVAFSGSDEGIANCTVHAQSLDNAWSSCEAKTGENGLFLLQGLAPGRYELAASDEMLWFKQTVSFTVAQCRNYSGVDIVMRQPCHIAGVVVDTDGNAVENASVVVREELRENSVVCMRAGGLTNAQGAFDIVGPALEGVYVQAIHASGIAKCLGPLAQDDPELTTLRLIIVPGGRVEGRVLSAAGKPADNAIILAVPQDASGWNFMFMPAAANPISRYARHRLNGKDSASASTLTGTYILSPLLPGNYTLKAYLPGAPDGPPAATRAVEVAAGQTLAGFDLHLDTGRLCTVKGTVTCAGAPAVNQCVELRDHDLAAAPFMAFTDKSGQYTISGVPAGEVQVRLFDYGDSPTSITRTEKLILKAGETRQVDFQLARGTGVVEGTVTVNGLPLAEAGVHFRRRPEQVSVKTDGLGQYRASNLEPGTYLVELVSARVGQPGWLPITRREQIDLSEGETARLDWDIQTASITATVSGVRAGETAYVALYPADAQLPDLQEVTQEKLDAVRDLALQRCEVQDGKAPLTDIDPGEYIIGAAIVPSDISLEDASGLRYTFQPVTVPAGQWLEIELAP